MAARRAADGCLYISSAIDYDYLDLPELGCVELHFYRKGEGAWYAYLVDCESGATLAGGRLFRR
jgi:hypothetical protein